MQSNHLGQINVLHPYVSNRYGACYYASPNAPLKMQGLSPREITRLARYNHDAIVFFNKRTDEVRVDVVDGVDSIILREEEATTWLETNNYRLIGTDWNDDSWGEYLKSN